MAEAMGGGIRSGVFEVEVADYLGLAPWGTVWKDGGGWGNNIIDSVTPPYGYVMGGWSTSYGGAAQPGNIMHYLSSGPATFYARWAPSSYTLTFDKQGGEGGSDSATATFGQRLPKVDPPSRPGWRFEGYRNWAGSTYYDAQGNGLVDWSFAGDETLVAAWAPLVTVDLGDATARMAAAAGGGERTGSIEVAADELVGLGRYGVVWRDGGGSGNNVVDSVEAPYGHYFAGWSSTRGGAVLAGDESGNVIHMMSSGAATYYASCPASSYALTFDKQGGEGGSDSATATFGQRLPKVDPPSRPGWRFEGYRNWAGSTYYDAQGNGLVDWSFAGDETLVAAWVAKEYAISYDCAGGELSQGAREGYATGDAFDLPSPVRYGYQFDGWEVAGVAEDGSLGPVQGAGVETATAPDGSKVTRVKAGTYGDLSCTARWTLRYDLDVPVCDPGSVTFEADSLTGQVRVAPGTSADGAILSYMAVPVALDSVSCEGLGASGEADPAGGAPELEAIFGAGSVAKVRFTATVGEGDASQTARLTAGGASGSASLAGLSVPAATSHADPGRVKVSYGLELDPGLAIPPVRDAAPVARLAYTVSLPPAGA